MRGETTTCATFRTCSLRLFAPAARPAVEGCTSEEEERRFTFLESKIASLSTEVTIDERYKPSGTRCTHGDRVRTNGMMPFRLNGLRNIIVFVTTFTRCLSGSLWSGLSTSPTSQNHSSTTLAAQAAVVTDARSGVLHSVSQLSGCLVAIGFCFIDCLTHSVNQAAGSHKTLSQVTTVSQLQLHRTGL